MDPREVLSKARLLYSAEQVDAALKRMAADITDDLSETNPYIVCVMNGGAFTAVNLCRHFRFAYEFDFVHVSRYGSATEGGELKWRVWPDTVLAGRTVLLVDDVLDRGLTLAALLAELARVGVAEVKTAVLVNKRVTGSLPRPPLDYYALEADDVYLFGCGMDFAGHWRGLPELYACDFD